MSSHQDTHDALSSLMREEGRHDGAIMSLFEGLQADNAMHGELDDALSGMPHGMKMDSSSFLDLGEHEHMQDNQSHNQHQHQHQHQHQGYHPGEEIPSPVLQPQHGHGHGGSGVGVGVGAGARAGPSSGVGVGNGGASGSGVGVGAMTHASAHEHDLVHGHSHVRQSQGQAQNDLSQGHGHQDYHAHSHPQSQLTRTPSAPSHTLARAHSPPKSSIPIPPELHLLASTSAPPLVGVPSFDISEFASETISDRGEMGGKRKKQPHERAGWKEMDEQGLLKKRNVGGRKKSTIDEFVGFMPMEGDSQGQGQGGGMQEAQGQQQQQGQVQGQGQAQGQGQMGEGEGYVGMEDAMGDDKRISKTEQNRRAQQIYRRRREERMKQLEADAQALDKTRRALEENNVATQILAFDLESAQIEITALHSALQAIRAQGVPILTREETLPLVNTTAGIPAVKPTEAQLDEAFGKLTAQSREVAKIRRSG